MTTPAPMTPEQIIERTQRHTLEANSDELRRRVKVKAIQAINDLLATTAKEARIAESDLWLREWGQGDKQIGDGSWEDYHEHRIATLTDTKEESHE